MTAERFAVLAQAYGSRIERWPEAEQPAANGFARTIEGRTLLEEAAGLDAMLDAFCVAVPGSALHMRVLATADRRIRLQRRWRWGWSGLGIVGGCLAGVLAGWMAITILAPEPPRDELSFGAHSTVFGDVGADAETTEDEP